MEPNSQRPVRLAFGWNPGRRGRNPVPPVFVSARVVGACTSLSGCRLATLRSPPATIVESMFRFHLPGFHLAVRRTDEIATSLSPDGDCGTGLGRSVSERGGCARRDYTDGGGQWDLWLLGRQWHRCCGKSV